ncbi:TonB-dependent receptor [Moritella sp. F3]|uniref:TonB-dependent receptor n=1 Tax=Moritella sp. F3 TaxID=2718882 RepID=UPI0018E0D5F6|nr:TonB-dependent receptor [Moritella sp. F3]GIC76420.1 ligand-gated channel protein [Moritella sp. F1]GIC80911.1 ligand-gated channel protein [Moritella sp. F3]
MKLAKSTTTKFVLNPILTAMLGLSVSLSAQAAVSSADQDESMTVVTANRSTQSISDIAATVMVIEGEQIAEQAKSGVDFKALLANLIPSLDVGSQSRTNAGQNMRGRSTLVMIDGISLNSSRGISRQFDSINPFNIARIEVISGASAMYGGGSTGGIINIITKKGRDAYGVSETWISAKSGLNSSEDLEYQIAQAISMDNGTTDARLAISYNQTGGSYDANGDMVLQDVAQTGSQYVTQIDIMGNVGYNLSDTKRIELMAQYYDSGQDSDYGIDYGANYSNYYGTDEVAMVEGYDLDDQAQTVRYLLTADYLDSNFYNQTMNLQLFYRAESMRFNAFPTVQKAPYFAYSTISASEQNTQIIGSKLVFTAQPTDAFNLVYGVDAEFEQFEATQTYYDFATAAGSNGLIMTSVGETGRYPDIESTYISAFLQGDYNATASLNLHAGIRHQYAHIKVGDFVGATQQGYELLGFGTGYETIEGGSSDYSNTLFNTGALYKLNEDQQVWLNLSQGFEIPDASKYYGKGNYASLGLGTTLESSVNVSDSPLEGIKTNSVELGWRLNSESVSTQFAAYYSLSDKSIFLDKTDYSIDVIDSDVRIYGLEAKLDYYLSQGFSLGGNFNYIISETKVDGEWKNVSIQSASPSKAGAYINWQTDKFSTRLQSTQMFDYTDAADYKLEGYNTVDLLMGIRVPVGKLQFGITNLLNTEYDTLWGQRATNLYTASSGANENLFKFQGQGRTYSANYSVEF